MGAIIFDLDGTLIDASRDIADCANRMLASEGLPALSVARVKSFVGNGLGPLISRCLAEAGREETPALHATLYARFQEHYVKAVTDTDIYPGAVEALTALRAAGHRLALCTNKPQAPTQAVMDHLDLTRHFEAFTYGDGPHPKKPDPAPVHLLLKTMAVPTALYVGDSETDAATARNAGLPFAIYTEGFRKTPLSDLAHAAAFTDFADLPEIADRLLS